ncbi:MAG TPA: hypothetical protein DDW78_00860 [Treponema sp.]|nr:hypothetical protein [Treponema sp.]
MVKTAVVFIADGSEEIEALSPVDYLRRAGVDVTLVSVGTSARTVVCSHKVSVNADFTLDAYLDSHGELPDAVVVPGGMPGAEHIAAAVRAVSFVAEMHRAGRLVCSICASPAVVLPATGALEGKTWTCYPQMEGRAQKYLGGYKAGVPFVHDGNLITGRGPGAAEEFSMEIVRSLVGEEIARKVKEGSLQR